jgi:hypothetical protein
MYLDVYCVACGPCSGGGGGDAEFYARGRCIVPWRRKQTVSVVMRKTCDGFRTKCEVAAVLLFVYSL